MIQFEGKEKREKSISAFMKASGIASLENAREICLKHGIDPEKIVKGVQQIAFENAVWAYTLGTAYALTQKAKTASEAANLIGYGLQAFCVPGSVADTRKVGLGHGGLGAMLLDEKVKSFCSSQTFFNAEQPRRSSSSIPANRTSVSREAQPERSSFPSAETMI